MRKLINKIKGFLGEVKQELAKCSMPTWPELKGSTIVIIVSMFILGMFSFVVDLGFHYLINWMIQ
jgi:preprotein translocase subunit SecE